MANRCTCAPYPGMTEVSPDWNHIRPRATTEGLRHAANCACPCHDGWKFIHGAELSKYQ